MSVQDTEQLWAARRRRRSPTSPCRASRWRRGPALARAHQGRRRARQLRSRAARRRRSAERIAEAADAIAAGRHDGQFPVDVFQTGSGTSSNMNANEVIATLAGDSAHANDHVNMGQSFNKLLPSGAVHLAALDEATNRLLPALSTGSSGPSPPRREVRPHRQGRPHAPPGRGPRDARSEGSAGLGDLLERLGLGAKAPSSRSSAGSSRWSPRRAPRGAPRREHVVGGLAHVHVVVGVRAAPESVAMTWWRACSTTCPSRSGRRRPGTARRACRRRSRRPRGDPLGQRAVEQPELGVHARRGALDAPEPAHDRHRDGLARNGEVRDRLVVSPPHSCSVSCTLMALGLRVRPEADPGAGASLDASSAGSGVTSRGSSSSRQCEQTISGSAT